MARAHNLIQSPELLARLAQEFGLRQQHINPTLNEGVQPVVIVSDLSAPERKGLAGRVSGIEVTVSAYRNLLCGAAEDAVVFFNYPAVPPTGFDWLVRFKHLRAKCIGGGGATSFFRIGWRDVQAAATSLVTNSLHNAVRDPGHDWRGFTNNNGGLGRYDLAPAAGVNVCANIWFQERMSNSGVIEIDASDFPVCFRPGFGMAIETLASPTALDVDLNISFTMEPFSG